MHVHTRLLVCILEISKRLLVSIFSCRAISDYTHVAKMSTSDKILKMIVQKSHSYQKIKIIYSVQLCLFFLCLSFFFFFFFS